MTRAPRRSPSFRSAGVAALGRRTTGLEQPLEAEPEAGVTAGMLADAQCAQRVAFRERLANWRTWLSFAVAVAILVLATRKAGIDWGTTLHTLRSANLTLFVVAFALYYASFPVRTHRWRRLMHNANHSVLRQRIDRFPLGKLTAILYLSFFANVIVPFKLGDVYRAYLARRWMGTSLSRTMGALLAERILDLVVLFPLLAVSSVVTFRDSLFAAHDNLVRDALLGGLVLAVVAGTLLIAVWYAGEGTLRFVPARLRDTFRHFRYGVITAFGQDILPLVGQTIVIWLMEGGRLACVLWALGLLGSGKIGLAAAIFLALGSSVLTTFPFTPGGLGVVDTFLVAGLLLLDVPGGKSAAVAVVVLDRLISYVSIAAIGFIVYTFTDVARPEPAVPPLRGTPLDTARSASA